MKSPVFTGTCTALITPFQDSGALDLNTLARQIDRQIQAGIDALCICGTTGESAALTEAEHARLVSFCVAQTAGRCKVIAGTGSNNTTAALRLSQNAQDAGADALLVVTPYYNKTTQTGLIDHYEYLADRCTIPLILYNVPSRTGLSFTADTYRILSQHPQINGVKEASGNFSLVADTAALCGDNLNLWSGNDDQVVPMMALGAKGLISVASNLIPGPMTSITHHMEQGELEQARSEMMTWMPLIRALFSQVNPIPIKAAMRETGLDRGILRLPLRDMDLEPLRRLQSLLSKMNLT